MKKTLLALALIGFAGTTAFAQDGQPKNAKKATAAIGTKASCSKDMKGGMAGGSCCMKGGKTASTKPVEKAPATVKL